MLLREIIMKSPKKVEKSISGLQKERNRHANCLNCKQVYLNRISNSYLDK